MKRYSSIILTTFLLTITLLLSSCGEVLECDWCINEGKKSKMHELDLLGGKTILCESCYEDYLELVKYLNN